MTIRTLTPDDAAAVAAIVRESSPLAVVSPESWLHQQRATPPRARRRDWIAEDGGRVVGNAWALRSFFSDEPTAICSVVVASAHRRRGIGRALWAFVEEHLAALEAETVLTSFEETDVGVAFAAGRGFREVRVEAWSVLDLDALELPATRADVELRRVADVDPRLVYEVDLEATRDVPSTETIEEMPYEEWAGFVLDHPLFTAEGSFLALVGGDAAAVSLLLADEKSGSSVNMFTGTRRRHRGRGLGLSVKVASIAWAQEHGMTRMATRNDETNAPMLAINRRLGFRPAARRVEWVKAGTASAPAPRAPAT